MEGPAELLAPIAPSVETEVRSRLGGFLGGMLRAYLPQAWVFTTDRGTASLIVEPDGRTRVVPGAAPDPDVTIELPFERLEAALATRRPGTVPPGSMKVTPHTSKGRTAFDYLRSRLGL
jgi:hypothetical protein